MQHHLIGEGNLLRGIFLLSLIFMSGSLFAMFGEAPKMSKKVREMAPYCKFYENLNNDQAIKKRQEKIASTEAGKQAIYQFPDSEAKIFYKDIVKYRYEASSYRKKSNAYNLKKKLMNWISYLNIEAKRGLYLAFDMSSLKEKEERLSTCLGENVSFTLESRNRELQSKKVNKEAFEYLLNDYIIGAVILGSILDRRAHVQDQYDNAIQDVSAQIVLANLGPTYFAGSFPSSASKEKLLKLRAVRDELKQLKESTLAAIQVETFSLVQKYPLLFHYGADVSLFNFFKMDIEPSGFYRGVIKGMDPVLWDSLKETYLISGKDLESLVDVFLTPELRPEMDAFLLSKYNDEGLRARAAKAASKYVGRIVDNSIKLCEQKEDHKLHYNEQLVQTIFQKNTSSYLFKELTVKDQAGYCHLLKEDPPYTDDIFSNTELYGIYSMAAGTVSQFITGRWGLATKFYSAGTALFGYNAYEDLRVNSSLLSSTFAMVPHGFVSPEQYKQYSNDRGHIWTSLFYELGLSAAGITALHWMDVHLIRWFATKYDAKKFVIKPSYINYAFLLTGKLKEGLYKIGSVKGREKYLALQKQKFRLISRMESRYRLNTFLKSLRAKLGQLSQNYDWPAYALYRRKKSHIDQLVVVLNRELQQSTAGKVKLQRLKESLKEHETSIQILTRNVDEAFNAKRLIPIYEKVHKALKYEDFDHNKTIHNIAGFGGANLDKGILTMRFRIVKNGKKAWSNERVVVEDGVEKVVRDSYSTRNDLKFDLRDMKDKSFNTVSTSIYHEAGGWSQLLHQLYDATIDHRVYAIAVQKLKTLKASRGLNSDEEEVLGLLEKIIRKAPPIHLQNRLLLAELPFELFDVFVRTIPFIRGKIIGAGNEIRALDPTYREVSKVRKFYGSIQATVGLSMIGALYPFYVAFTENGSWYHRSVEKLAYMWRQRIRSYKEDGATTDEIACAKELDEKQFNECYRTLAFQEIGYEWAVGLRNDEPFYENTKLLDKLEEFSFRMVRLRKLYRVAEVLAPLTSQLNLAYEYSFLKDLVDKIELALPSNIELEREVLGGVAFALIYASSPEEFRYSVEKFRGQIPEVAMLAILKVVSEKTDYSKLYRESVRLPVELEEFIETAASEPGVPQQGKMLVEFFDLQLKKSFELMERDDQLLKRVDRMYNQSIQGLKKFPESNSEDSEVDELLLEIEEKRLQRTLDDLEKAS